MDRQDYSPELLLSLVLRQGRPDVLRAQQTLFWMRIAGLVKLGDDLRIIESFVVFSLYFFKPLRLAGASPAMESMLKAMWRVNFVNENYKYVEAYTRQQASDKSHQWIVALLQNLQLSYYTLAKAHYAFNEDVSLF